MLAGWIHLMKKLPLGFRTLYTKSSFNNKIVFLIKNTQNKQIPQLLVVKRLDQTSDGEKGHITTNGFSCHEYIQQHQENQPHDIPGPCGSDGNHAAHSWKISKYTTELNGVYYPTLKNHNKRTTYLTTIKTGKISQKLI